MRILEFLEKQRIKSARVCVCVLSFHCVHTFDAMYVYEGDLACQLKSGCLAVPVVEAGCGRWRVLSRQYEAYVRDQCWTVEITEMRREEGLRGLRETEITGGLVP